jgi:two-component sensor histidine kinase
VEAQAHWPPPESSWIGMVAFLVSGGLIVGLTHVVATAIRALNDANRQERLLVLELQHRVKNTLAIIQAIAGQTFGTRGEAPEAFTERLVALGRAHNVLSEAGWREVTMRALVERAVEPFVSPDGKRIRVRGDDLRLGPDLIVDLALCLHELAVNALKHGALSAPAGRVEIAWRRLEDGRIELSWSEHDGPQVSPPARRGFGSRLLERGLSRKVRPAVVTDLRPEGLRWIAQFDAG